MENIFQESREFLIAQHLYNSAISGIRTKLDTLDTEFRVKYDYNPIHSIEHRLKSHESILGKLKKYNFPLTIESMREHLFDVAGVRVICNYVDDINNLADLLIQQDDIKLIKRTDYIAHPKENGYRSLHIVVKVPVFLATERCEIPVEIQIRTIAMNFWASLEHHLRYKGTHAVPEELYTRLVVCAESIAKIDLEMQSIYSCIQAISENPISRNS